MYGLGRLDFIVVILIFSTLSVNTSNITTNEIEGTKTMLTINSVSIHCKNSMEQEIPFVNTVASGTVLFKESSLKNDTRI